MGLRVLRERKVPGEKRSFAAERHVFGKGDSTPPAVCNTEGFRSCQNM